MLKTLKEILRVGNATVKYPFAPISRPEDARGKPEHDARACFACSACAVVCPSNAIQMQVDTREMNISWSINYGRCIYCGRCEEVCPTKAIVLTTEFELAVMSRSDLEEICTYKLYACAECASPYTSQKEIDYAALILSKSEDSEETELAKTRMLLCPSCRQRIDAQQLKPSAGAGAGAAGGAPCS